MAGWRDRVGEKERILYETSVTYIGFWTWILKRDYV